MPDGLPSVGCCLSFSSADPQACQHLQCLQKLSQEPWIDFDFIVAFRIFQNCRAIVGLFYISYPSTATGILLDPIGPSVLTLCYCCINLHEDPVPLRQT